MLRVQALSTGWMPKKRKTKLVNLIGLLTSSTSMHLPHTGNNLYMYQFLCEAAPKNGLKLPSAQEILALWTNACSCLTVIVGLLVWLLVIKHIMGYSIVGLLFPIVNYYINHTTFSLPKRSDATLGDVRCSRASWTNWNGHTGQPWNLSIACLYHMAGPLHRSTTAENQSWNQVVRVI